MRTELAAVAPGNGLGDAGRSSRREFEYNASAQTGWGFCFAIDEIAAGRI